ncbi:glutathione S-transferase family protein [Pseudidiomarina terrestris]|uniref:Glutathione S-transferase family protein n=1 Tax=Pseudidiomarina terrestris TaxID=2820060 RepID=A0AAW7R121_9GAMM|nr:MULTISPECIES: glutathione S-transferase family protein [unclassified Pseudidiomarina]MDN7125442.1 glutathione S-transferase family protein [Pseudidiomarina sp. 1APP75-32.1]MDN7128050.1 glutathione S-transferase family protein [Pseudidiomarina sp. 1APR75-33.1]MDN7130200.1 glutathione S-transferase family protein [Pseudidiomarina sp. 1APR75-15]MDN7135709.1 glutathione S-transferase family protein [Pseudidiomarina sp. 1ASP75-5]MDN7137254.1 glutathione S-transferase family protein [Pseudidiomar
MKLYETKTAPNPRRVRMFLAEKGLLDEVECIEIDLQKGENLTPEFAAKNPMKKVPVLELDNGTCIAETMAICRYFEIAYPDTVNLLGQSALEQAEIEQWLRWLDYYFFIPCGMGFQHTSGFFKDRMTPVPEWGELCVKDVHKFMLFLNEHLEGKDFICCDRFTAADITAFAVAAFARVIKIRVDDSLPHLLKWYKAMQSRPSAEV